MLSDLQILAFSATGFLKLENFIPVEKVNEACRAMFERLEERHLWKNNKWTLSHLPNTPVPEGVSKLLGRTGIIDALGELFAPEVSDIVFQLLDRRLTYAPLKNGQVLFTIPNSKSWSLPHSSWHTDISRLPEFGIPGVQAFTFLNRIVPQGGGTVIVAGSHLLLNDKIKISSKKIRQRLKKMDYFKELMDERIEDRNYFMTKNGIVDGKEQQVVELHGKPGDVYLMDMRILHNMAPNAGEVPRIMVTKRFFLEKAYKEMYGAIPTS